MSSSGRRDEIALHSRSNSIRTRIENILGRGCIGFRGSVTLVVIPLEQGLKLWHDFALLSCAFLALS